ncbi:hypothetical protein C8J57DRAFT_209847 [Mycena rebaudengoi]|nr:hypothetical protein C8J57DRAFT_209847 [Mycena rebaudengoi]
MLRFSSKWSLCFSSLNMPIPTFAPSPQTGPVFILADRIPEMCGSLPPAQQRALVEMLDAFRAEVETKGNDIEYLKEIWELMGGAAAKLRDVVHIKDTVLDVCHWRLAMCLRYSTPTRIAEAVPYLEKIIAKFNREHSNGEMDLTPALYLAVALHKVPGQEAAAVRHFKAAYAYAPTIEIQYHHTQLWSRACFSRLLRRLGRIAEAMQEEKKIRNWLQRHPYCMHPSAFRDLVTDPQHQGKNYILDHPTVQQMLAGTIEIGPFIVFQLG